MTEAMETMLEATARLRAAGYRIELTALPGARLRCAACGEVMDADSVTIADTVRFEGDSNPDDQAVLVALVMPCGHRGLFSSAYGPAAEVEAAEVLRALRT